MTLEQEQRELAEKLMVRLCVYYGLNISADDAEAVVEFYVERRDAIRDIRTMARRAVEYFTKSDKWPRRASASKEVKVVPVIPSLELSPSGSSAPRKTNKEAK